MGAGAMENQTDCIAEEGAEEIAPEEAAKGRSTLAPPLSGALHLPRDPQILARLARRGVTLVRELGETRQDLGAWIETALMALFRDSRRGTDFQALHEYASPRLLRQISLGCRGQGRRLDPRELCQDAFVNMYRYASSFRDQKPYSFHAWSQVICRNIIRRHISRRSQPSLQALPEGPFEPVDHRAGPALCASLAEDRTALLQLLSVYLLHYAAAFQALSPRAQAALHLVEVERKSYAEVCEILGLGMSNMKMIMFRSRKRIAAHIAKAMGEEPRERATQRRAG